MSVSKNDWHLHDLTGTSFGQKPFYSISFAYYYMDKYGNNAVTFTHFTIKR